MRPIQSSQPSHSCQPCTNSCLSALSILFALTMHFAMIFFSYQSKGVSFHAWECLISRECFHSNVPVCKYVKKNGGDAWLRVVFSVEQFWKWLDYDRRTARKGRQAVSSSGQSSSHLHSNFHGSHKGDVKMHQEAFRGSELCTI